MRTEKTDMLMAQLLLEKQKQIFELAERVEKLEALLNKAQAIAQDAQDKRAELMFVKSSDFGAIGRKAGL